MVVAVGKDGATRREVSRAEAHEAPGILHLAVSVQVFDPQAGWLLQRRAASKAAFARRWANTCCTHPLPGEHPAAAGLRRAREELGLVLGELVPAGTFIYRAVDEQSGLVEHELDHVFVATADTADTVGNPEEVSELARLSLPDALRVLLSDAGAPWAAEVLRRAAGAVAR